MSSDWPFEASPRTTCLTTRHVLDGAPVLHVTHDADDGGWQFMPGTEVTTDDAKVVGLGEMCKRDPTLRELADLPEGWRAWRSRVGEPWQRVPDERDRS
jgi:hypothetical protein